MSYATGPDWFSLVVVAAVAVWYLYDWYSDDPPEPDTLEHAQMLYEQSEISLCEFERRVDIYEDPEAAKIRSALEQINGIDTATSFTVAEHYDTLRQLRNADSDELEDIHGIGPAKSESITKRLRSR